jgi:hypothetical protein
MSLLLPEDPGSRWTRTVEPGVAWPSSYTQDHQVPVEIILILEFPDEL